MSVEAWKTLFDWASVVFVGFTVIVGAGALITGKILNDRQGAQLSKLSSDLAGAQKLASDAQKAERQVEIDLARQKEKAALAELRLLELQERIKPRNISPELAKTMVAKLGRFSGQKIDLRWMANSPEAGDFAGQIKQVLNAAGWSVAGEPMFNFGRSIVSVCFDQPSFDSPALLALADLLKKVAPVYRCGPSGYELDFVPNPSPDGKTNPDVVIVLTVGIKT